MSLNSIEHFHKLLSEFLGKHPYPRILLSQLGTELRGLDPEFSPRIYGYESLRALIEASGHLGNLQHDGGPVWWFIPANVPQRQLPTFRIKQDWWKHITNLAESPLWLDLKEQTLIFNADEVEKEPERYLDIPRFAHVQQRELIQKWQAESGNMTVLPDDIDAWRVFARSLSGPHQKSWSEFRVQTITRAIVDWASKHGVNKDTFQELFDMERERLQERRQPSSSIFAEKSLIPVPFSGSLSEADLRTLLHRAADELTYAELLAISLPLRLFI